jgi:Fe2+ transport system protein FeoA
MFWKRRRKFLRRQGLETPCQHLDDTGRHRQGHGCRCQECDHREHCSLREVPAGQPAVVQGFSAAMPANRRTQLQAYGLLPGQRICVRQHYPVTVIQIDYTELALEDDLAAAVEVEI